jgi:hypothetical protein
VEIGAPQPRVIKRDVGKIGMPQVRVFEIGVFHDGMFKAHIKRSEAARRKNASGLRLQSVFSHMNSPRLLNSPSHIFSEVCIFYRLEKSFFQAKVDKKKLFTESQSRSAACPGARRSLHFVNGG